MDMASLLSTGKAEIYHGPNQAPIFSFSEVVGEKLHARGILASWFPWLGSVLFSSTAFTTPCVVVFSYLELSRRSVNLQSNPWRPRFLEQPCKTRGPNLGWCFTPCSVKSVSEYRWGDHDNDWCNPTPEFVGSRVRRLQTKKRNGEMEQTYRDVGLQAVNHTNAFEVTWRTIMTSIFRRSGSIADGHRIILLSMHEPNIVETHVCHSRTGNHSPLFWPLTSRLYPKFCVFC